MPPFPVYLFDLDGTLLDSAPDICGAIIGALEGTGCRPVTQAELTRYIGLHLLDTFGDLLPAATPDEIDELIRKYRIIYPARGHKLTKLYPGVQEALTALPGRKSTATTKATPTTRTVLELFGLIDCFDHVQGTDGFPHKPAPDVILKSLEFFGVSPADVLFVGDSPADMEAGRRAGVKTAAVTYGYGAHEDLARWNPDYWLTDLRQLL
ncbi:MAG TPA: HAD-IA family hydrolase [Bryobacteraceae bacterium]|nr:HAD-IA family hydrolase [Bryobacteraceae bacterium]